MLFRSVPDLEDDVEVRDLIAILFQLDGRFEIVGEVGDGAGGVEAVRRYQPDAVVLDLHLPIMPGTAAIAALRDVLATRWSDLDTDDFVVTINYAGEDVASYEVAPVFDRKGGGYLMPNGSEWMATDPTEHARLVTDKNKECNEGFVPLVKMIKGINREAGDPIDPSFLLEVMGLELVLPPFGRYRDEIRFLLASIADRITEDWPDPAHLGSDVNSRIASSRRSELATLVRGWLAVAEEALLLEDEGKERAAVEKWRELFGWRMPRP